MFSFSCVWLHETLLNQLFGWSSHLSSSAVPSRKRNTNSNTLSIEMNDNFGSDFALIKQFWIMNVGLVLRACGFTKHYLIGFLVRSSRLSSNAVPSRKRNTDSNTLSIEANDNVGSDFALIKQFCRMNVGLVLRACGFTKHYLISFLVRSSRLSSSAAPSRIRNTDSNTSSIEANDHFGSDFALIKAFVSQS